MPHIAPVLSLVIEIIITQCGVHRQSCSMHTGFPNLQLWEEITNKCACVARHQRCMCAIFSFLCCGIYKDVYVCIWTYLHICMHMHTCGFLNICIILYVCLCVHMCFACVSLYVCVNMCLCVCVYVHVHEESVYFYQSMLMNMLLCSPHNEPMWVSRWFGQGTQSQEPDTQVSHQGFGIYYD